MSSAQTNTARQRDQYQQHSSSDALYRMLPSVNDLLLLGPLAQLAQRSGREHLVEIVRTTLDRTRSEIAHGQHSDESLRKSIDKLPAQIAKQIEQEAQPSLRRVINATGVLLHTNLGRAPLSDSALNHIREIASGYSNLEFDLDRGERGKRDAHVERLLLTLLGKVNPTHRAIVVNNCAAATYLALHTLARGKQVLVSRAELVEIGGGFRIPDILEESGAVLREVGTTNRTRIADYERAITPDTGLILRVHQSNFAIEGFVEQPQLAEPIALGERSGIPVFEDLGTGLVESLEPYGVRGEPTLVDSIAQGCNLVAASGDKLLGGPQCGILAGRKDLIDRVRSSPLYRIFRADKLNYAALEATLIQYVYSDREEIPVIRMLRASEDSIRTRCERIADSPHHTDLVIEVIRTESMIGGGTTPRARLASYALSLRHARLDASGLLRTLRTLDPPVISRIENERVLLDLRTVEPEFDEPLISILKQALDNRPSKAVERG